MTTHVITLFRGEGGVIILFGGGGCVIILFWGGGGGKLDVINNVHVSNAFFY